MTRYFLRRLAQAPIILALLITVSFFLMRLAPGGPFQSERGLDAAAKQQLSEFYGLDKPLPQQLVIYMKRLLSGDFGLSYNKNANRDVNDIIKDTLPHSLELGAFALALALALGLTAGCLSALYARSALDYSAMTLAVLGISLPLFVIGPLLQLIFARELQILPLAEWTGWQHRILPALTLALPFAARIARLMRAGMLDILHQDFIRTARAKGLWEYAVIWRHALRGGILPVVSYLGPATAAILTGSLVVEKIFQIPGLGREFVQGATERNYTLVMATVIIYGVMIILFNLIVDIVYSLLDPRVRYQ